VYTAEDVFSDPHVKARGMIMPVTDPAFGTFGFARTPPLFLADGDRVVVQIEGIGELENPVVEARRPG
jgi:2-keto-4-pentenoate hydratase/2-oxohepta-3-ene-1,7-dioic acid hydratase in catechol pathway